MPEPRSLWEDLQQRRVVRAVIIYAVVGWGAFEVTETVVPYLNAPEWVPRVALILLLLGFPLVAGLAWAFDVDRSGVQRAAKGAERGRMWVAVAGAAVVAVGIGFFTVRSARTSARIDDLDPEAVAVSPFRASVGPELAYLGEGMVDLLAVRLSEEDGLRPVDPSSMFAALGRRDAPPPRAELDEVARRLGAGRLISGGIVGDARQITITAELTEVGARAAATQAVTGSIDSLPVLVDRLVSRLLSLEAGEREDRIGSLAGSPPEAVRDYLRGRSLYRAGDYEGATEAFVGAIRADSTFALAGIALANAAGMTLTDPGGGQALGQRTAWRHRERLPPEDREFLRYFLGDDYPGPRSNRVLIRDGREAEQQFPDRIEAVYLHADAIFHWGRPLGVENPLELSARGFRRLLEMDPQHVVGLQHLLWNAVQRGDTAAARGFAERILAGEASGAARWEAARFLGVDSIYRPLIDDIENQPTETLVNVAFYSAYPSFRDLITAGHDATDRAMNALRRRAEAAEVAPTVFTMELSRGHMAHARDWLGLLRRQGDDPFLADQLLLLAVVFADLQPEGAREAAARLGAEVSGPAGVRNTCVVGLFDLHEGRVAAARAARTRLAGVETDDDPVSWEAEGCGLLLEAQLAVALEAPGAGGRVAEAEAWALEGYPIFGYLQSAVPLALGRLHAQLGEPGAAQRSLARCCAFTPPDFTFTTYTALELAEVAAARADTATARSALQYYLSARATADGVVQSDVERARALLDELVPGD